MSDAIEADVRWLRDIEEIKQLRYRYAYGANIVDGKPGNLRAFAELFAEDGTWDVGLGPATGPDEIEAAMRELTVQWRAAKHFMINPLIEVDGDRGRGTITGLFAFTSDRNPRPIWLSILYDDTYVRTDRGWRFQSVVGKNTIADPDYLTTLAEFVTFTL